MLKSGRPVRTIASRQHDVVKQFRDLAAAPDPMGTRLLLDGAHLVREARRAGATIEVVGVATPRLDGASEEGALARELAEAGVDVVAAGDRVFDAMSPVRSPSGIVAIARRPPATAADVCARAGLVLAAIDVQDPGNLGSLLRAAEAGGVSGVLVCGASANPFSWKAVRGSMGSVLRVPVATAPRVKDALTCMKNSGLRTIASTPRGGVEPDAAQWSGKVGLLVGGEGPGLDPETIAACDERVTIPMAAPVESLNVAVAAALLVYAARRQRI
jgi:RNA methyltransferase, TrmH family